MKGDFYLPKGTAVVLMMLNAQLRPDVKNAEWDLTDPLQFNPNRWDSWMKNEDHRSVNMVPHMLAFSLGKR